MVQLVRHRQTKGSETDRLHLTHRVTPRLHIVARDRRFVKVADSAHQLGRSSSNPFCSDGGSPCAFHSARRACITSMRAARAAGSHDATTAAASSTNAE